MAKIDAETENLQGLADAKRKELGYDEAALAAKPISSVVKVPIEDILDRDRRRTEQQEAQDQRRKDQETHDRLARVFSGKRRYFSAHVNNFVCKTPEQRAVVARIRQFAATLDEHIKGGDGLLLFGPPGTGKDHLMAYLIHITVLNGTSVRWENGMDLFGDARDRMDDDRKTERGLVESLASPRVLAISDPLPPFGGLTQYQSQLLYRIIERRSAALLSTWVTMNVKDAHEADKRLSAQTVDRLNGRALVIPCNWPSYRKPLS